MQWKSQITLILGLFCALNPSRFSCAEGRKLLEADNVKPSNSGKDTFEVGRTFSVFEMLQNQIYDTITNITLLASGLGNDIQTTVQNQTSGLISSGGGCGQTALQLWDIVKIPIFIIAPATIIGVAIAIKVIGLIVAWIPSVTSHFFEKFKSSEDSDSDSGYGWSSPSQGYAPAPSSAYGVPSSSYGAPSPAYGSPGGGGLSRQTSILTAIDNLSNMYGNNNDQTQPQKMLPNNLEENYSQAYQGGQSVQSSAQNNYPYYYYQNQPVQPGGGDGYAEKTNLDNSQLPQPNETPTNVAG
ncbi:uncharacterized protein LOC110858628 [Folsomia candida]|uniref:Uncharacterized protein n=1 Tax=Folsomia candida TaxID=158441 RepID=A0A226DF81_FOLCA|nr:uncharacterized protein LOC110858628 [Folsomia candida]OXA43790.1 hypothetical protein Fcan01_21641 [Folsomia candida]